MHGTIFKCSIAPWWFLLWINIMKATMKILKGYSAEDCIAMAIAHKGVSYKIFGEKGDCYQIPTSI